MNINSKLNRVCRIRINPIIYICSLIISGCSQFHPTKKTFLCPIENIPCIHGTAVLNMNTTKGIIKIEVNGTSAPVTAGNFVDLSKKGVYDGTAFHRVIKTPYPYIIQGGDPTTKLHQTSKSEYGKGLFIEETTNKIRYIPFEIKLNNEAVPRYGKTSSNPDDLMRLELKHEKGSLAMARSQSPNSASSQFYITLRKLDELNGRYAVFGKVIDGMEIVEKINQKDKIISITLEEK